MSASLIIVLCEKNPARWLLIHGSKEAHQRVLTLWHGDFFPNLKLQAIPRSAILTCNVSQMINHLQIDLPVTIIWIVWVIHMYKCLCVPLQSSWVFTWKVFFLILAQHLSDQVCLSMTKQENAYYVGSAGTDGRGTKLARHCGAGRCSLRMCEPLCKKCQLSHTLFSCINCDATW